MEAIQSQKRAILAHLQEGKDLTQIEALVKFGSFRLGARIYELKRAGHPIRTDMVRTKKNKRVARYHYDAV